MAKESDSGEERTEQPTSKRIQESREKGQVCKSTEVSTAFLFAATVLSFYFYIPSVASKLSRMISYYLDNLMLWNGTKDSGVTVFYGAILKLADMVFPIFLVFLLVGIASNLVQIGFIASADPIKPKFSKLNPISGFKQKFFSAKTLEQLIKSVLILCAIAWVAFRAIRREVPFLPPLIDSDPSVIVLTIFRSVMHLLWDALWLFIIIATADFTFQKWQYTKDLMMTKQEIKDEGKQTEGNPQIKSRIRSIQMQMARRRMMKEVPKADVVITNPTHLAVALQYKRGEMGAPICLAKGAGPIAKKIREVARESSVPIVEDKPLARTLYKTVDIGDAIPEKLYRAVAEILAYVYGMKKRA